MTSPVLVQIYGITPPKRWEIREIPVHDSDQTPLPANRPVLQLGTDEGRGCRTDELWAELSAAGLRLVDVHVGYRHRDIRDVPILNLRFDGEVAEFIPPAGQARQLRAWLEKLLSRSWVAGRVFVNGQIICINVLNALPLDPDHQPLSIGEYLTVKA